MGSGFNVAMRDLDIRGAGNLLGAEQSGFIAEIGFNMYHKILDEAIQELRDGEFKEVIEKVDGKQKPKKQVITSTVETDFDARIPEKYVSNVSERINLYTQLSALNKTEDLDQSMEKIIDRFGKLPKEVSNLFLSIRLKIAFF